MELIERVRGRIMKAGIVFSPSPPTSLSSGQILLIIPFVVIARFFV